MSESLATSYRTVKAARGILTADSEHLMVRHHCGVTRRPGLPPGAEAVLQRIRDRTGSLLEVVAVEDAFSEGPQHLEVVLDELSIGTAEFWWDDEEQPEKALADLREWLSWFLDQEFSNGWW